MQPELPILEILPDLLVALRQETGAVLIAPPGAGKTTMVAPALIKEEWCSGQVVVTSPRRIAARAAAERMAELLGEEVGRTIGYATRLDTRQSAATRIVVVSEAILVNRLIAEPDLPGVSALLFDEAHERHLACDLALALALESRAVLRPDLRVLVMSATIDGARYSALLGRDAPVITSEGKAYPLTIRWLGSSHGEQVEDAITSAVLTAWREEEGDILTFLPGVREIARVEERLAKRLQGVPILPLHGQLGPAGQRAAIRRHQEGRRIVLATSIAETSLTLDGVSVVVDSGLARRAEFDRTAGTTRLVTVRASQAAAAQRAGRAARQGPGVAYRMWEAAAHTGRPPFDPPEITTADLSGLLLALAQWGTADPASLAWLDPPPAAAMAAARQTLQELGALDEDGRITPRGRQMATLPLDPQAAAMVLFGADHGAAPMAARLALLLQERGLGGSDVDLAARLGRWNADGSLRADAQRKLAARWARMADELVGRRTEAHDEHPPLGIILAAGRPDFIAKRRMASGEHWLSAGGRGFTLDPADPLAACDLLVVGDAQGKAQAARITSAAALDEADLVRWLGHRTVQQQALHWIGEQMRARVERRLGAVVLASGPDPAPDETAVLRLLVEKAVDRLGALLPPELLARGYHAKLDSLTEERLRQSVDFWLAPLLIKRRDLALPPAAVETSLMNLLSWEERQELDKLAPTDFTSPAGTRHPIIYTGPDAPAVEIRVQALFGLDRHPVVGRTPLLLKLTSPAGRLLQATRDLPAFWRGSWADVRKEMKGRYPKHRWPEHPWMEEASLQTKKAFSAARG